MIKRKKNQDIKSDIEINDIETINAESSTETSNIVIKYNAEEDVIDIIDTSIEENNNNENDDIENYLSNKDTQPKRTKKNITLNIFLKLLTILFLFALFLIYSSTLQKDNKVDSLPIVELESSFSDNSSVTNNSIVPGEYNEYILDSEYIISKDDNVEDICKQLVENNKKIVSTMLYQPLSLRDDIGAYPYVEVSDKTYTMDKINSLLLSTYTEEYVNNVVLSYDNPIYFETDGIIYYNYKNNFAEHNEIIWDTMIIEDVLASNETAIITVSVTVIENEESNTVQFYVNAVKTERGWRLENIIG